MPALRQYKLPSRLPDQALQVIMDFFASKASTYIMVGQSEKNGQTWYHYEALFEQGDEIPDVDDKENKPQNELPDNYKTDVIIPHKFIGYETVEEYEIRKGIIPDPNQ